MSADGRMYVADTVSCRIRRLTQATQVVQDIQCKDRGVDLMRPSGCSMYDDPTDSIDLKATPMSGNIFYNYEQYFRTYNNDNTYPEGRKVQPCVGSPEPDIGIQSNKQTLGPYAGTGFEEQDKEQDLGDMTLIRFRCPLGCDDDAAARRDEGLDTVIGDQTCVWGRTCADHLLTVLTVSPFTAMTTTPWCAPAPSTQESFLPWAAYSA